MTNTNTHATKFLADIDAIRARHEAATPGPWLVLEQLKIFSRLTGLIAKVDERPLVSDRTPVHPERDAEFIAHARTDIATLLAYIAKLEERPKGAAE